MTTTTDMSAGGIGLDPVHGGATLMSLAETIQQVILPHLQGHPHKAAVEVVRTLVHLAAAVKAPQASTAAMAGIAGEGADRALAEGRVYEDSFARAEALIRVVENGRPATDGRSFEPARVETWLRSQGQGGDGVKVLRAEPLPGGRSKQTILVSIEGARALPSELVIRQDWAAAVTGTSVAMEFEVLRRLHHAGLRVPQPLLLEPGAEALGAPFIVVTRLPGRAQGNLFDPPPVAGPVRDLAEQIARTHALPVEEFDSLPGVTEHAYTSDQLKAELAKYRGVLTRLLVPMPHLVAFALDWLDRTVGEVHGPRTLVHGDVGFHNNLCDGEQLTGVLDWEMVHLGNPARDVGYLKAAVEKAVPWDEFMQLYRDAGGPPLDPFVVDWYSVYTKIWFMHLLFQARAAVSAGVLRDIDYTAVCAHYPPAALANLSRSLARALGHGR